MLEGQRESRDRPIIKYAQDIWWQPAPIQNWGYLPGKALKVTKQTSDPNWPLYLVLLSLNSNVQLDEFVFLFPELFYFCIPAAILMHVMTHVVHFML